MRSMLYAALQARVAAHTILPLTSFEGHPPLTPRVGLKYIHSPCMSMNVSAYA